MQNGEGRTRASSEPGEPNEDESVPDDGDQAADELDTSREVLALNPVPAMALTAGLPQVDPATATNFSVAAPSRGLASGKLAWRHTGSRDITGLPSNVPLYVRIAIRREMRAIVAEGPFGVPFRPVSPGFLSDPAPRSGPATWNIGRSKSWRLQTLSAGMTHVLVTILYCP